MRRSLVIAATAALALAACSRRPASPPGPSSGPASAPPAAGAAPEARPTAQAVAGRLVADGLAISTAGFSVDKAITCGPAGPGVSWSYDCTLQLHDAARDGAPAIADIRLYDHDVDFAAEDAPLKAHVAGLPGRWTLNTEPDITVTDNATGAKRPLPAACHQSLGARNSAAYCALLASPRAVIVVGVRPQSRSTRQIDLPAPGSDQEGSKVDVNHAETLLIIVAGEAGKDLR